MKKIYYYILGAITGFTNGIFGSGGGLIAVPLLEKTELNCQESHATSIAITLPLSIISSYFYLKSGNLALFDALKFIPAGIVGAIAGGFFLKRIPTKILKKIFGIILVVSAVRLLLK